jgi:peptide/nickel transport system permease protein
MSSDKKKVKYESPGRKAWERFMTNKLGIIGAMTIIIAVVIGVLGYLLTPDSTPFANDQVLNIGTKNPGFEVTMLLVKKNKPVRNRGFFYRMFIGQENEYEMKPMADVEGRPGYRFEDDKIVINEYIGSYDFTREVTLDLINVVHPLSVTNKKADRDGDIIEFYDVADLRRSASVREMQKTIRENQIVRKSYFMGTDRFGRDNFSRLIIGVRISLAVGFIAVLISLVIGISLGAIAGYFRGRVDDAIMWLINVIWSIPTLLLIFAITMALGRGFWQIFVAVGLTMWVDVARIIRGQVIAIREQEFIEAAKSLGFGHVRIIAQHVLPNVLGPVMVIAAANFAYAIIIEAGLSYLGIGVQPPVPSWGTMMKEHADYLITNHPFLAIVPGLAIMIMVLAFNMVGNGFRDALDVRTKFRSN